jgi:hypothetical protein
LFGGADYGAYGFAEGGCGKLFFFASADGDQAFGFQALGVVEGGGLSGFRYEFAGGAQFVKPGFGGGNGFAVFEKHYGDCVGFHFI